MMQRRNVLVEALDNQGRSGAAEGGGRKRCIDEKLENSLRPGRKKKITVASCPSSSSPTNLPSSSRVRPLKRGEEEARRASMEATCLPYQPGMRRQVPPSSRREHLPWLYPDFPGHRSSPPRVLLHTEHLPMAALGPCSLPVRPVPPLDSGREALGLLGQDPVRPTFRRAVARLLPIVGCFVGTLLRRPPTPLANELGATKMHNSECDVCLDPPLLSAIPVELPPLRRYTRFRPD